MKKIQVFFVSLYCLSFGYTLQAQSPATAKGASIVSGTFNFSSQNRDGGDWSATLVVLPSYQYFLANRLSVGVNSLFLVGGGNFGSNNSFRIGPSVAYYLDQGGLFIPYVNSSVQYGRIDGAGGINSWTGRGVLGLAIRQDHFAVLIEGGYEGTSFRNNNLISGLSFNSAFLSVGLAAFIFQE